MKRGIAGLSALCLLLTGCAGGASSSADSGVELSRTDLAVQQSEMTVSAADLDPAYADVLERYFRAVEQGDFDAYKRAVYPPYLEAYEAYLSQKDGSTLEDYFRQLHTRFDEDGYSGWHFTQLSASYYSDDEADVEAFLTAFQESGVFDADFTEQCRSETDEIRDIAFSLRALYDGDTEDVQVVSGSEIIAVKTANGAYLFG